MKTCKCQGYDCVELVNGIFRINVTTCCGPRVIGGFIGDDTNIFAVLKAKGKDEDPNEFELRGGHRLWHSPEAKPRTYCPDNMPVSVAENGDGVLFRCEPEAATGIRKSINIAKGDEDCFVLTHSLENCGLFDVTLAPWALSVMAPGGFAVLPQGRDTSRNPYIADRSLVLWAYSNFNDPRLRYEDDYIFLRQDSANENPIKIGFYAADGWIAYVNNGKALVKGIDFYDQHEVTYPDNGCNIESYSCNEFCEIETLGPLFQLEPGESCEHVEIWQAIDNIPEIRNGEDFSRHVLPRIKL